MKSLLRCLSVAVLALAFGFSLSAEEKKPSPFDKMFTYPKTITLSDEQTKKVADLQKEYTPKLEELKKKIDVIVTKERADAQKAAIAKAKEDGKKGKEVTEAGIAAMKLTEEETKTFTETKAAQGKLTAEINKKKMELLTEEQQKALPKKPTDK